ncbi:HAMP domain-containing sensor histidine kinase [Streptosporangium sp. 'caverna']|uniref:sensor histidine kinase n=1 Tax=Streptosporangium sp. 'caverna' TaxID=2202249 RepID=UPI000D7EA6C5|nr:HAMP domain-containing sensor histidine kinase [Streptosporangium sp. 'caverna']AWS41307.1 two-component sensor histidine kinase [Streptosporangium sp. 'caverna']
MKTSVRLRFALACGAVFVLAGAVLLVAVSFVVRQSLEPRDGLRQPTSITVAGKRYLPPPTDPAVLKIFYSSGQSDAYYVAQQRVAQVRRVYQRDTVKNVLTVGGLGLLAAGGLATAAGWRAAGWVIRPVRSVTESVRQVAQSHDLAERIAHDGPEDEIKELADSVDGILGRLARSYDGQRRFIANASHELRTPLTINRTLVDVAVRRPDATEDVRRLGESLLMVNTRHERLIDALLALSEGERTVLDRRPFDLADVVEHVLDLAAKEAGDSEVTVHRLLDPAPTAGEAVLVERLAQNLVENAIRHNHPGGEVWVSTRQRADRVELMVANTGLPVPSYEIETIFEPFRRLHGDRLRSDRGSGLGLSIVRVVAEAHSGTVTASPREEGGLTIAVELPREQS